MKILIYINQISLLISIILLLSCQGKTEQAQQLTRAQEVAESNPLKALAILDSIHEPDKIGKDFYMQYIVTRVQAKHTGGQDITNDTLIFDARKYFNNKNNTEMAALANFYTGHVYLAKKMQDKSLDAFLESEHYARLSGNYKLTGKASNNIGYLYYEHKILDSAIVRYKIALMNFDKTADSDLLKLHMFSSIGSNFYVLNKIDSACLYFTKGLNLAYAINDTAQQVLFKYQLGASMKKNGEYTKANTYLNDALKHTPKGDDLLRIYLNLLISYNSQHKTDSAKYYADILKTKVEETTFLPTTKSIYNALSEYNKLCGNYPEALHYSKLCLDVCNRIIADNKARKLLQVVNTYRISVKEKEIERLQMRFLLYLTASLFLLITVILGFIYYQKHKKEKEKNRLLKIERDLLTVECKLLDTQNSLHNTQLDSLAFALNTHQEMEKKWSSINKEIETLAASFGAKEKPALFVKIEDLIKSLEQGINEKSNEWVQTYLREHSIDEKISSKLNKDEKLLLLSCCSQYTKEEVAELLGIPLNKVYPLKLKLKHKLKKLDIPDEQINEILFD